MAFALDESFNHNLFRTKVIRTHMIPTDTLIALLQLIWRGGPRSGFNSISNIKFENLTFPIIDWLLIAFCFFFFSPTDTHASAQTPDTEIYLHYRCFYLSPSNFSLNSASMYNAFEGYWIGFFFPPPPSIFSFVRCCIIFQPLPHRVL